MWYAFPESANMFFFAVEVRVQHNLNGKLYYFDASTSLLQQLEDLLSARYIVCNSNVLMCNIHDIYVLLYPSYL